MSEKNKTIQQATQDLATLVAWFDSDEFVLEQALEKFQAAKALADAIETQLSELENSITIIKQDSDA